MCAPTRVKFIQLILVSLEESMFIDSSEIDLFKPIESQIKVTFLSMLKFSLTIEYNLGYSLQTGCLRKDMSINEIAILLSTMKTPINV